MAKKFKEYYDIECAGLIAGKVSGIMPEFRASAFVDHMNRELNGKEFLARQDAFADAFGQFLTGNYEDDIRIFHNILGPELQTSEGMFTHGYWLWPVGRFVERYGVKNIEVSVDFCYELTKRFTGEFAMRPLIAARPKPTLQTILKWSTDPNVHVRRLSSECLRISLPWAKKSRIAIEHFGIFKAVLGNLKNDPEKFVQKSVGNNLNDLMKENPVLAKEIISEWEAVSPSIQAQWIIRHGMRSLRTK